MTRLSRAIPALAIPTLLGAKGAVVGAGAGTGVVLATRGKEVTIPAGSRWRVRLARALALD
jgi:hypothetical protein